MGVTRNAVPYRCTTGDRAFADRYWTFKACCTVTNQFGVHELDQTMSAPIAWTWKNSYGNRVFTTSLGHAKDFANQNALRVLVNGVFWSAGRSVPPAETVLNTFSMSAK